MQPRTIWIGGSYDAACGKFSRDSFRAHLLEIIKATPGKASAEICALVPGVPRDNVSRTLYSLRVGGLIHRVKATRSRASDGVMRPMAHWYPGKAPRTVNHMKAGRPKKEKP